MAGDSNVSSPDPGSAPRNSPFSLRQDWPAPTLALVQLLIVIALAAANPGLWPADDDVAYLDQGLTLRLGGFPSAPTRPVFYPWLVSLGMRLFGLRLELVALLQGLLLPIATILLYHFARRRLRRPFALLATLMFGLWPGVIFFSFRFYREFPAAFMLVLVLSLIDRMRDQPKEYLRPVLTGIAAGALVMLRPEFGTLLALWAVIDAVAGLRQRRLLAAAAPWVIAGALALVTVSPAVLAARAAFGEWIFISTYTGVTYTWSFCGDLPDDGRDFWTRDRDRIRPVHPRINRIIYFSDPSVPFSRRDAILWDKAKRCVAHDPGQALTLVANRAPLTWFQLSAAAADMIQGGQAGVFWPPWSAQALRLGEHLVQLLAVLLIGPGLFRLWRRRDSRPVALVFPWFMFYYATVFFVYRYRITVLPVMALGAGAGAEWLWTAWRKGDRRRLLWGCALVLGAGAAAFAVSSPGRASFLRAESWRTLNIRPSLPEGKRKTFVTMLADNYVGQGRYDLMRRELPIFLRARQDQLGAELLAQAAGEALEKDKPTAARLFAEESLRLDPGHAPAVAVITTLDDSLRTVELKDWSPAGSVGGFVVHAAVPPAPLALDSKFPPEELRLEIGARGLRFLGEVTDETEVASGDWFIRDGRVMAALAASDPPPSATNPARLTAYFRP